MILPVKFLWEQLDGPQITAIENALFQYFTDIFDTKLDYLSTMNVDTANDSHLTFLGILANFVRPVITVPDREFFYFTNDDFKSIMNDINDLYELIIKEIEKLTDKKFGKDYVLV